MFKFLKRIDALEKKVLALEKHNMETCKHDYDYKNYRNHKYNDFLCFDLIYIVKCKKCGHEKELLTTCFIKSKEEQDKTKAINLLENSGYKVKKPQVKKV